MARKNKDVFGFDELEKAFKKVEQKYPARADALLKAMGQQTAKKVRATVPVYKGRPRPNVKPGQLKRAWRVKGPKEYKSGKVKVVRVESTAPHAHLIEEGHRIVTTRRERDSRGRYLKKKKRTGKTAKMSFTDRAKQGVKNGGYVQGKHMLSYAIIEARRRYDKDVEKMLDKLIKESDL